MEERAIATSHGSARLGSYLRRLRAGYGYSLRRVEERARAEGGEIDNSQLSRYEKGICYPSFDKLRVLASVFNVSVQAFSDVVDLEEFETLKESGDPETLLERGNEAIRAGDHGRAFALYESAVERLEETGAGTDLLGRARTSLASALTRLGKLALAEQELRRVLRIRAGLSEETRARALLNLANLHADQGDLVLAEIEAERACALAPADAPSLQRARGLHTLGRVLAERAEHAAAIVRYREAIEAYERCGHPFEIIRVRTNIGACYVALGKIREGIRILRAARSEAHRAGFRRLEAHALSNLGEAYARAGETGAARACLRESDALAGSGSERYPDLMFFNAYHEWRMAMADGNPTREKIAFGRLRALRSSLERTMPEADAFDAFVERGRSHE
jgi:tetratricopeptide (TPR) repeat protein